MPGVWSLPAGRQVLKVEKDDIENNSRHFRHSRHFKLFDLYRNKLST
jgi:hypothetical protein